VSLFGIVYRRRHLQYALADLIVYLMAIQLGHVIAMLWGAQMRPFWEVMSEYTEASVFLISSTVLMLYLADGYQRTIDYRRAYNHMRLWAAVGAAQIIALVVYALFPQGWWGPWVGLAIGGSQAVLLSLARYLLCRLRPDPIRQVRLVVLGDGRAARLMKDLIECDPDNAKAFRLVGFVKPPNGHPRRRKSDYVMDDLPPNSVPLQPMLGTIHDLPEIVGTHSVDHILVAHRAIMPADAARALLRAKAKGAVVEEMATLYKRLMGKVPVMHVSDNWLIYGPMFIRRGRLAIGVRRIVDVAFCLVLGLLTLPVVLLAMVVIRLESKGSPIYVQERLGRDEQPFPIYKLRTMVADAEKETGAVWSLGKSDPRVTRVGRFLRRSRIDELPQLYNVLRGDMSLVGPRPEREHFVRQLEQSIPFYALRFAVKPGLTGWAQVNHRYGNTDEDAVEKLRYELYEIQELTFALYLLILLKTVQTVLMRAGS
jgi:exopolysaccharide biosynthesis polyprenyl glycosylphosphotransferase